MCKATEKVPIGQGCKVIRRKDRFDENDKIGRCACHIEYYLNSCLFCGNRFHTKRKHARTCSDKCRMALSRSRRFDIVYQALLPLMESV
jgi:predicted nucleic acid-binding Zn ribbon protein